jgi:hypothetical protein
MSGHQDFFIRTITLNKSAGTPSTGTGQSRPRYKLRKSSARVIEYPQQHIEQHFIPEYMPEEFFSSILYSPRSNSACIPIQCILQPDHSVDRFKIQCITEKELYFCPVRAKGRTAMHGSLARLYYSTRRVTGKEAIEFLKISRFSSW